MASYAMAHLKMDILLGETGCDSHELQDRLRIFLTNSLEEYHPDTHTLFASWLSDEAREANSVKKDTPVMVVMGNPPYSVESSNKGDWIMALMDDYKKEPGGKEKLKERNPKSINDDYVKFMRFAQHFIEKNGEGILAFINPHSFLDNLTFRGMRWNLLKTYDEIYTIDLHGNAKKKETCPDGSKDENVFDIEQGVSINLLVKTGKKKNNDLGKVFHYDLYGKRQDKYDFLTNTDFSKVAYQALPNVAPMYFMVPKDFKLKNIYDKYFSLSNLFQINSVGILTARDKFTIQESKASVNTILDKFLSLNDEDARHEFSLGKDVQDWKVNLAREDILQNMNFKTKILPIDYRPFDIRFTYYTGKPSGFHCRPRHKVMSNMIAGENIALMSCRQTAVNTWEHITLTKMIVDDSRLSNRSRERGYVYPLYIYPEDNSERIPNLNQDEIKAFEKALKSPFEAEKTKQVKPSENFVPIDILDYIYAVLHSPNYREKYKEFLKTDFPRIPYPNPKTFWQLVELGGEVRKLHLLESDTLDKPITPYPQAGDNIVSRKITKTSPGYIEESDTHGNVWINDEQYFENVSLLAWEFYIGGYQPAQKWLKDRQGRELSFDDIRHYQKIIVALTETDRLMQEIDKVLEI